MRRLSLLFAFALLWTACEPATEPLAPAGGPVHSAAAGEDANAMLQQTIDGVNLALAASGAAHRVLKAEWLAPADGAEAGTTVLAKNVGNKQLAADFVPGDPRRAEWSGPAAAGSDDITYAIDQTGDAAPFFGGLSGAQTTAAIQRAMESWEVAQCSQLPLREVSPGAVDLGFIAALNGLGGSLAIAGDVQHAGWRDVNFAGGVLGVTFTLVFIDDDGNPTDIDADGQSDVAFREIYYDPSFSWADDGAADIDVESVAVHEAGHGLSQGHFGTVSLKNDGSLKASPRAVMNALYSEPFRALAGSDGAGHCSNWASWPNG